MPYFLHIATFVHSLFKSRHQLRLENLALPATRYAQTVGEAPAGVAS